VPKSLIRRYEGEYSMPARFLRTTLSTSTAYVRPSSRPSPRSVSSSLTLINEHSAVAAEPGTFSTPGHYPGTPWQREPYSPEQQECQLRRGTAKPAVLTQRDCRPGEHTLAATGRDLVAQHEDLGVLRGSGPREQHKPAKHPAEDQMQQARRHSAPSSPTRPAMPPLVNAAP
jgi:hypothetical protein